MDWFPFFSKKTTTKARMLAMFLTLIFTYVVLNMF